MKVKMNLFKRILLPILCLLITSCANIEQTTKKDAFPYVYKEKPIALLIVPIINNTTAADAPGLYYTTLKKPLAELGYYVLPIQFTQQILQEQGIINGEVARSVPLSKYKEAFGADAVLFITINAWDTSYRVVASNMMVSSHFSLYSTKTKVKLWGYNNTVNYQIGGNGGGGAIGLLVNVIATAIETSAMDYVPIADEVNRRVLFTLPKGLYSPKFEKDGQDKFYGVFLPLRTDKESFEAKKFNAASNGYSNIYLYRKTGFDARLLGVRSSFWLNGECVGDTSANIFFKVPVKSGSEYVLQSESNTIKINAKSGVDRYFEQVIGLTRDGIQINSFNEVKEKLAQKEIKALSLGMQGTCVSKKPIKRQHRDYKH